MYFPVKSYRLHLTYILLLAVTLIVKMHYVPGGLTFPIDNETLLFGDPTIANAYGSAETEVTNELWAAVSVISITSTP